jgi:hypothetical protein
MEDADSRVDGCDSQVVYGWLIILVAAATMTATASVWAYLVKFSDLSVQKFDQLGNSKAVFGE